MTWRGLVQAVLVSAALALAAFAVRSVLGWQERLEALARRIEKMIEQEEGKKPTELRSEVPCPRTGIPVEVVTFRHEGETPTAQTARHLEQVEATIAVCAVSTPGGGGH